MRPRSRLRGAGRRRQADACGLRDRGQGASRALQPRLAEKGFNGFAIGVRRSRPHAGERQMCETMRQSFDHSTHLILLVRVEVLQLLGECAIRFRGCDALERTSQLGKLGADGARGKLLAQAVQAFIDCGSHWREAQKLGEPTVLRGLDHLVHADAMQASALRRVGVDVRRQAEVDDQHWARGDLGQTLHGLSVQNRLGATGGHDETGDISRLNAEGRRAK